MTEMMIHIKKLTDRSLALEISLLYKHKNVIFVNLICFH